MLTKKMCKDSSYSNLMLDLYSELVHRLCGSKYLILAESLFLKGENDGDSWI